MTMTLQQRLERDREELGEMLSIWGRNTGIPDSTIWVKAQYDETESPYVRVSKGQGGLEVGPVFDTYEEALACSCTLTTDWHLGKALESLNGIDIADDKNFYNTSALVEQLSAKFKKLYERRAKLDKD